MGQFRFETEVQVTATIEYIIEADSVEEALEQLQTGEHRGRGITIDDDTDWGSEVITVEEILEE
jgi:D-arabinose 1-dehydrogenase-like Zn-dependent alcohol dehydrogenase